MRAGIRRPGDVGCEDTQFTGIGAYEPHETRAEHGVGGIDELGAERVDGGEGLDNLAFK